MYFKDIGYGIEIDGDFWHGNLNIYNSEDIHPVLKIPFKEVNEIHNLRLKNILENKNIKFIRNLWVSEITNNKENILKIILNDIKGMLSV